MKKTAYVLSITLILTFSLCACASPMETLSWQEQYDLGVRYLSEGNYQEAIIAFAAAIEIDPKQAPAYVGRGDAYMLSGETEENLIAAKADYEKAIELDETSSEAYLGLADVYIRQGKPEKAAEILRQGADRTEDSAEILEKMDRLEQDQTQKKVADIRFDRVEDNWFEHAVITGVNSAGDVLWTYTTPEFEMTELTRTEEIGLKNGLYYFNEGGTITALDPDSGEVVWKNDAFGGASICFAFNDQGELFLAGYYGPDFFWMDKEGNTIRRIEMVDGRYFWPSEIRCYDTYVEIAMHGTPDEYTEQPHIVTVSLEEEPGADNSTWREAYLVYIQGNNPLGTELVNMTFQLIYVDDDSVPELWVCGDSIAAGSQICTFDGEAVHYLFISEYGNLHYIERSGRFHTDGGRMDEYWDQIYLLQDGRFASISSGDFGAEDNANVQFDGNGRPIYLYRWDGTDVTEREYRQALDAAFDFSAARDIFDEPPYDYYQLRQMLLQ